MTPEGIAERRLLVSPDGRRVIAHPLGEGPWMSYPLDGAATSAPVNALKMWDRPLAWAPDGASVYIATSPVAGIFRVSLKTGERQLVRSLSSKGEVTRIATPYMTPDARTLVYTTDTTLADLFVVSGLR